jgi:hypothetical protein
MADACSLCPNPEGRKILKDLPITFFRAAALLPKPLEEP